MTKWIKLFLRIAVAAGFLSAVADRFGMWGYHVAWGNWNSFLKYVGVLLPGLAESMISVVGIVATAVEIVFALFLLIGWKLKVFSALSGILILSFALAMTYSTGIKSAFDASVFAASAAAFAISSMPLGYLELDTYLIKKKKAI